MRILVALTYYRPHVSGLTIYAERLARGLARRGHEVTVLTSRFHPRLLASERLDGVRVVRVPVVAKVSKGVVMPLFPLYARTEIRRHDLVNVHMPQLEAALLAALGRLHRKTVVLTYQCDLRLPPGLLNRIVQGALVPLNHLAARLAHRVTAMTRDYADHSPFLRRYQEKFRVTPPLVELPPPRPAVTARFVDRYGLAGRRRIAFAARFAAEKGVEMLLRALPRVASEIPDVCVVFTGAAHETVGEQKYHEKLRPLLEEQRERLFFFDLLSAEEMASFFALADVLAVTSLNSTESFGLVQAEAMLSGTPVVATDLPGVREAVRRTGMGEIVPPGDPEALARALLRVLRHPERYVRPREEILRTFSVDEALDRVEEVFRDASHETP
ncbi:MAG: glycosyl transferase family 1 [Candidatus Binatia bacterium]|nr:MAG: glycosyl transferase family 1 [Candidatus Binatia bacterium]